MAGGGSACQRRRHVAPQLPQAWAVCKGPLQGRPGEVTYRSALSCSWVWEIAIVASAALIC